MSCYMHVYGSGCQKVVNTYGGQILLKENKAIMDKSHSTFASLVLYAFIIFMMLSIARELYARYFNGISVVVFEIIVLLTSRRLYDLVYLVVSQTVA